MMMTHHNALLPKLQDSALRKGGSGKVLRVIAAGVGGNLSVEVVVPGAVALRGKEPIQTYPAADLLPTTKQQRRRQRRRQQDSTDTLVMTFGRGREGAGGNGATATDA